jgi:purine-binding chemotaxis protein CheW
MQGANMEQPRNGGHDNGGSTYENATAPGPATFACDEVSPEMLHQIWAERAARLAQVPEEKETGEQITLLLIRLGREVYGLDAQYVDRIEPVAYLTRVPRVPAWVAGVTNLRGRVLSVVDLVRYFGLSTTTTYDNGGNDEQEGLQTAANPYLVVVGAADMELAFLVDRVMAVERVPLKQIQEATDTIRGLRPEYVRGVVERRHTSTMNNENETLVIVLDLPNLLADERLIVHEEMM